MSELIVENVDEPVAEYNEKLARAKLYQKIVKVMGEVGQLQKDGAVVDRNGKKMYNYLSEEQTTGELQRAFVKHGLVMFPVVVETELIYLEMTQYDKEVKVPITKAEVTYKICDMETGECELIESIGYGSDSQDKGSNKAMTGAFKYAQRQTFMISTGDDPDHTSSDALNANMGKTNKPGREEAPPLVSTQAVGQIKVLVEQLVKMGGERSAVMEALQAKVQFEGELAALTREQGAQALAQLESWKKLKQEGAKNAST